MEKQELSNTVISEKKKEYNKTTVFLTKFIFGEHFETLKKLGYVDSYCYDSTITQVLTEGSNQRFLFLLFQNKKLTKEEVQSTLSMFFTQEAKILFSYELVNDFSMVVLDFPSEFVRDYDNFKAGKYSKLSNEFKKGFPVTQSVLNSRGQRIGSEYTIYHHIFNKTEWLKNFWMERLNLVEIDDNLELWHLPERKDLEFDRNSIM